MNWIIALLALFSTVAWSQVTLRDAQGRIAYIESADGPVYFHYALPGSQFFDYVHHSSTGWIEMPDATSIDTLGDDTIGKTLKTFMRKCFVEDHNGKSCGESNTLAPVEVGPAPPPDIIVDVVAHEPTRAWRGIIGGPGGPVSVRHGYPFVRSERYGELLEHRHCVSECSTKYGALAVGCGALSLKKPYAGLACSALAFSAQQACERKC